MITGHITALQTGNYGLLTAPSVEKEYGVRFSSADTEQSVRQAVITESFVNCVQLGPVEIRRWVLQLLPEVRRNSISQPRDSTFVQHWPVPGPNVSFTPLLACVHWRKLKRFIGAALALLSEPFADVEKYGQLLSSLLHSRILPEVSALKEEDALEIRAGTVQLVLHLLSFRDNPGEDSLVQQLGNWYQRDKHWKECIETALQDIVIHKLFLSVLFLKPLCVDRPVRMAGAAARVARRNSCSTRDGQDTVRCPFRCHNGSSCTRGVDRNVCQPQYKISRVLP